MGSFGDGSLQFDNIVHDPGMRVARRTYQGAFHHGMNRRYEGRMIFRGERDQLAFLEIRESDLCWDLSPTNSLDLPIQTSS